MSELRASDDVSGVADVCAEFSGFEARRVTLAFVALLLIYVSTMTTTNLINDTAASSAAAWNVAENGTLDFGAVGFEGIYWRVEGADGQILTNRFPGSWLPAIPTYAILPTAEVDPPNVATIPLGPGSLTAAVLVAGGMVALADVFRSLVGPRLGATAAAVVALGTPMWSVAADQLWTHSTTALVLSLAMLMLLRERWWAGGALLGYAIMVRPTLAIVPLVVGLWLLRSRRGWTPFVAIGVTSAAGLALLAAYSRVLFSTWLPVAGYRTERVGAILGADSALTGGFSMSQQIIGTFLDPYHGVFVYTPLVAILFFGVGAGWGRAPDWARAVFVGGVLYWVGQLRGNPFPGGYNFYGYRFPLEPLLLMSPVLLLGFRHGLSKYRLATGLVAVTAAVSVFITAFGAVNYGLRDEPLRTGPTSAADAGDSSRATQGHPGDGSDHLARDPI